MKSYYVPKKIVTFWRNVDCQSIFRKWQFDVSADDIGVVELYNEGGDPVSQRHNSYKVDRKPVFTAVPGSSLKFTHRSGR